MLLCTSTIVQRQEASHHALCPRLLGRPRRLHLLWLLQWLWLRLLLERWEGGGVVVSLPVNQAGVLVRQDDFQEDGVRPRVQGILHNGEEDHIAVRRSAAARGHEDVQLRDVQVWVVQGQEEQPHVPAADGTEPDQKHRKGVAGHRCGQQRDEGNDDLKG